jgi:hypothetical protein
MCFCLEFLPYLEQHGALHVLDAVLGVRYPKAQLELQRALAELDEQALRLRVREHSLGFARRFLADRDHLRQVRLVVHAQVDLEPRATLRVRPVLHALGDQRFVRDQVLDPVARADQT